MAKKTVFSCEACGHETFKWMGKCPKCGGWDTIKEFRIEKEELSQQESRFLFQRKIFLRKE